MFVRALRGLAAASVLVVAVASTADAQAATKGRFSVSGGLSLPMGDFADGAGLGFVLGANYQAKINDKLEFRFTGDFGRYGGEDDFGIDNTTMFGAMANLIVPINTTSALKPYLLGGLGFYSWEVEGTGGGSVDGSDLAFNVGVGYNFNWGSRSMFTELRFVSLQTDPDAANFLPITIGMRF